jgi:putative DNA primase/helicase
MSDFTTSFDPHRIEPTTNLIDYRTTDAGNADRLIGDFGRDFRYCEPMGGWLHWNGVRWKVDNAAIWECAKSVGKALQREAAEADNKNDADRLWQHGRYSLGEPGMRRIISLAEKDSRVRVEPQTFDADHYLLNVLNGTIDLRTGQMRDHDRDDLITKLAPVSFDPKAKAPAWYRFVRRMMPNGLTRRYLRKAAGQALAGAQDEQAFYLNQGIGDNGKNTFYDALLAIVSGKLWVE